MENNLSPKDKATELLVKFLGTGYTKHSIAKSCALICVNEILTLDVDLDSEYWLEVKYEIGKL